jgi:hypothetical protein
VTVLFYPQILIVEINDYISSDLCLIGNSGTDIISGLGHHIFDINILLYLFAYDRCNGFVYCGQAGYRSVILWSFSVFILWNKNCYSYH